MVRCVQVKASESQHVNEEPHTWSHFILLPMVQKQSGHVKQAKEMGRAQWLVFDEEAQHR